MADNTIDTLDIQIESSATKAIQSINGLIKKLEVLNKSLNGINTGGLRNYSKELGRVTVALNSISSVNTSGLDKTIAKLNTLSKINLSNLKDQKISLDLDIKGGNQTQKLQYAIDKTIRDVKVDTSVISGQLINAFNLKGGAASKIRAQMNELSKTMASSYDGTDILAKLNDTLNNIANTIIKSGSIVKGNLGSYLDGVEQEWVDFYNFFKNKRIYVSDMLKADVGKGEFKELLKENLSNVVRDAAKGINLNESWGELADRFPTLIPKDTINATDQLITVLGNLKKVRDSIKPISIQELSGKEATQASDKVWEMSVDAYDQLAQKIRDRIQSALKNTNGQLPIDVKINTDKITLDIQKAINRVAELKYNAVKVNLDVDTSQIKDSISAKLKQIDAGQMEKLSNEMKNFSSSLSGLSSIDFKSSGLNSFINAMSRLTQTKIGDFDVDKLETIMSKLFQISNIPDVSSGVNRFVSAIAKLAGTGTSIGTVSSELTTLGAKLKETAEKINSIGEISESVNLFVQSLGRLASAGNKTSQTASQLSTLSQELLKFFDTMKNAPNINSDVVHMIEALGNLANAGGRVGGVSNSASRSFNQMSSSAITTERVILGVSNAFGRFSSFVISLAGKGASAMLNLGKAASSASQRIKQLSNPLSVVTNKLSELYAKMFLAKRAVQLFISPIKSAMNYVETLNYFNAAFKQVAGNVDTDEWKKSGEKSAETYANSFEERAKQLSKKLTGFEVSDSGDLTRISTASLGLDPEKTMQYQATFGQMASSMGNTSETALKLSNALTMIGSDLASVRNMDFEDVWEDMASGLTGMSRVMDKYGINIRNANMQQELYNLGINTSISNLSQADKTILRTIILLNNSKYAWGDLASTLNQPANQIRMLQSNFASLGRTIGSLFIPILQTALPYINAIVIALQRMFAWIAKLLGIKLSNFVSSTGGISVDTGDIADNMDDTSDAIDSANDNAKKLKKTLSVLSFDELNQLNDNSDSSTTSNLSSSSDNSGISHLPALDDALSDALSEYQKAWDDAFKKMSNKANKMADAIVNAFKKKDWEGLGKTIANGINQGMQKLYDVISWNNVGPYITKFAGAFTTAFNSLVDNIDWDLMGRTIGAGITTLAKTFNLLTDPSTGINFEGIGRGLSMGLRGIFNEVPWTEFGNALGNGFMISWRLLDGFVQDMSRKNDAGITGWQELGTSVAETMNGIFKKVDFSKIASTLTTGINGAFDALAQFTKKFDWNDFTNNLGSGISKFIADMNWKENGAALGDFLSHLCKALRDSLTPDTFHDLGVGIGKFLGELPWGELLFTAAKLLIGGFASAMSGLWESGLTGKIVAGLTTAFVAVKVADITGIGTLVGKLISHIGKKIIASENAELIASHLSEILGQGTSGTAEVLENLGEVAGTSGSKFASLAGELAPFVGAAGLCATLAVGIGGIATKVSSLIDSANGGNGVITDFGYTVDNLIRIMQNSNTITAEQKNELFLLKEQLEDTNASADEYGTALADAMAKGKISSDDLQAAVSQLKVEMNLTEDETKMLAFLLEQMGQKTDETATKTVDSATLSKTQWSSMKDSLLTLYTEGVIPLDDQLTQLRGTLQRQESAGATAEVAYRKMKKEMENMGMTTEDISKVLSTLFPDATTAIKTAVDTNIVGAQEQISSSMATAKSDVEDATSSMASDTKANTGSVKRDIDDSFKEVSKSSETEWGDSYTSVKEALKDMEGDTLRSMQKIMGYIQSYWKSVVIDTNSTWELMSGKVEKELSKMKEAVENISSSISTSLSGLIITISNSFNGMYGIGQNAMQQLANGMRSVHISTPHMYMNMNVSTSGNRHSYSWNSGINWYAKGGLFDSASVIGVGEAGQEAVLPLTNQKAMKNIADSIMSGYDGNVGLSKEELAAAVERGVVTAMMNNGGFGGSSPEYIMNSIKVNERELARIVTKAQNNTEYRMNPSPTY